MTAVFFFFGRTNRKINFYSLKGLSGNDIKDAVTSVRLDNLIEHPEIWNRKGETQNRDYNYDFDIYFCAAFEGV